MCVCVWFRYRSGIYFHDEVQRQVAETAKARVPNSVTEIEAAGTFWPAEVYHQQ